MPDPDALAAELERLERVHAAHWPAALRGDHSAAHVVLRTLDRRVALLGLDRPPIRTHDPTREAVEPPFGPSGPGPHGTVPDARTRS